MDKIFITGLGLVSSIGIGKKDFWQGLKEAKSGVKDITLFDTSNLKVKKASYIENFKPEDLFDPKKLRTLDRTTKLLLYASKLALDDANLNIEDVDPKRIGISIGTTLGSIWSISKFDRDALIDGPHFVNPADFPNTVINSPASEVAIFFGITGPCSTISSAFSSSFDAIKYAINLLNNNHADIMIVGGVDAFCEQVYLSLYRAGFLAGLKGQELSCPFDKRRNGIIYGEGACVFILEKESLLRNSKKYAYIKSLESLFFPFSITKYDREGRGLKEAIERAIIKEKILKEDISYILSCANSTELDLIETNVIKDVFGKLAYKIPVSSIKGSIGETFSASGALNLAASLGSFELDFIPPTINFLEKDSFCDLDYVFNKPRFCKVNNILINSAGFNGDNFCLILSK